MDFYQIDEGQRTAGNIGHRYNWFEEFATFLGGVRPAQYPRSHSRRWGKEVVRGLGHAIYWHVSRIVIPVEAAFSLHEAEYSTDLPLDEPRPATLREYVFQYG